MVPINFSKSYFHWKTLAVIFGSWTLIGFLTGNRHYLTSCPVEGPAQWGDVILKLLLCYGWPWALITPLILYFSDKFPLTDGRWRRHLIFQLPLSLFLVLLVIGAEAAMDGLLWGHGPKQQVIIGNFLATIRLCLHTQVMTYWVIIGLHQGMVWYRRNKERELESAKLQLKASEMEASLRLAQLNALKMQLHPHFLFNTLNIISVLMQEDSKVARQMLLKLSDLLRATLKMESHEITLKQELELLQCYLEIEQTRFQDRLTVRMNIDPAALDARVPTLILQPLVENAIKHGIALRAVPGVVEISATNHQGVVELRVADNGSGMNNSESAKTAGVGVANIRERLERLYLGAFRFEMKKAELGGLEVLLSIPHRSDLDCSLQT